VVEIVTDPLLLTTTLVTLPQLVIHTLATAAVTDTAAGVLDAFGVELPPAKVGPDTDKPITSDEMARMDLVLLSIILFL
jgi:hypothetical protein